MSTPLLLSAILAATLIIEAATVALRFGLGLQSTRDTAALARLTFGIRIHHGYIGALVLLLVVLLSPGPVIREVGLIFGWSMLLSDLIHHFLVLWPITGSPEFDLVYGEHGQPLDSGARGLRTLARNARLNKV